MNEFPQNEFPAEEAPRPSVSARPGIFYENLTVSQEEAAKEHSVAHTEDRTPLLPVIGCVILLMGLLLSAVLAGQTCDPSAAALTSHSFSRSNESFAIYFWDTCRETASALQENGSSVPFDPAADLSRQYYDLAAGYSWQEYFMEQAAQSAALTAALVHEANAAGYILPEAQQTQFTRQAAALDDMARAAGCSDGEDYIHTLYGSQVSRTAYEQHLFDQTLADSFASAVYQNLTFTEEEIADYYAADLESYADLKLDTPNVDLRHILFIPTEETAAANSTAKQNAEDAMAQCLSGGEMFTEDIFLRLVSEYSQDAGSSQNGGLLENLAPGRLNGSFDAWAFAPERSRGDMAVLSSDYGWHLVYFVGQRDNYHWQDVVQEDMRYAAMQRYYADLLRKHPCSLTPLADVEPLAS